MAESPRCNRLTNCELAITEHTLVATDVIAKLNAKLLVVFKGPIDHERRRERDGSVRSKMIGNSNGNQILERFVIPGEAKKRALRGVPAATPLDAQLKPTAVAPHTSVASTQ